MGKRVHVTQGEVEFDHQGEPIGGPVEVAGKDVRTPPLPLPIEDMEEMEMEAIKHYNVQTLPLEPEASATPEPYVEPKRKPVVVNPTLAFGWRRYMALTKALQAYLDRLAKWAPPFSVETEEFSSKWESLGQCLEMLVVTGAKVRITDASRRSLWLRPGAHVALRQDVRNSFLAIYPKEVLENVTVDKLVGKGAFLVSGDKVLGLVPIAHLVKP
jgi:hypothetical protein